MKLNAELKYGKINLQTHDLITNYLCIPLWNRNVDFVRKLWLLISDWIVSCSSIALSSSDVDWEPESLVFSLYFKLASEGFVDSFIVDFTSLIHLFRVDELFIKFDCELFIKYKVNKEN